MFESRISAGKPDADISSWSKDMEGHAKKCVERYCELANKTTQQLYKVVTHAWMTINLEKKKLWINWRIVHSLLTNCSEILFFFTRSGRPDI